MLSGDFFKVISMETSETSVNAVLELNSSHKIFEGHFPGQPVVPGVCMIQMIKEILEQHLTKKTRLVKSDYAKFLAMIDPRVDGIIRAEIKYATDKEVVNVTASLFKENVIFLKLRAAFSAAHD